MLPVFVSMLTKALKIVDIKERALTIENIINLKTMPNPTHHHAQLIHHVKLIHHLQLITPSNSFTPSTLKSSSHLTRQLILSTIRQLVKFSNLAKIS